MPDELIEGNDGIIEIQEFDDSLQEAASLADQIARWVDTDNVPSSEIAVLVSKQASRVRRTFDGGTGNPEAFRSATNSSFRICPPSRQPKSSSTISLRFSAIANPMHIHASWRS